MTNIFPKLANALRQSYISRAFGFLSVAQAVNAVSSFGVMTVFTRFLSPEDYGRVSLLWLFIMILSIVVDSRLNSAYCIKHYKVAREENIKNIYSILLFNLVVATCIYLLWISFPGFFAQILQISVSLAEIRLVCLISLTMVIAKFLNSLLLVTKKAKLFFWSSVFFNFILLAACGWFLFFMKLGYFSYLYGHLLAYGVLSCVCLGYLLREYAPGGFTGFFSFKNLTGLIKLSFPLIPDAFLLMILAGAGRYLLNIYSGLALVAIYSVSYMFASVFNTLVLGPFGQAITPVLYEKYAKAEHVYTEYLSIIFKYYWIVLMTLILGFYSFFRELFPLLVGEKYVEAFNIIGIIMLGLVIYGAASILSCTIVLKEKTHLVFLITLISAVVNILSSLLLIPGWGLYGAALASFAGYFVQALLMIYFSQKMLPINFNVAFLCRFAALLTVVCVFYIMISQLNISILNQILLKMAVFSLYLGFLGWFINLRKLTGI